MIVYMLCYRYMSYERFLQSIKPNGVFLKVSRPIEFNDPYDCTGVVEGKMPLRLRRTYAKAFQKVLSPEESDLACKVNGRRMFDRMYRILSLCDVSVSGSAGETLMWSHYADCSRGIRVGLDIDLDRYKLGTVDYKECLPKLEVTKVKEWKVYDDPELRRFLRACLLTKNKVWEYEQERRIVFRVNDESIKPFSMIDEKGPIEDAMMVWTPEKEVVKEVCLGSEILQIAKSFKEINVTLEILRSNGYVFKTCRAARCKEYGYDIFKY